MSTGSTAGTSSATSQHLATITAMDGALQKLLRDATLADHAEYDNALLTILDGEVNVLASGAGSSLSYATFTAGSAFHTIAVEEAVSSATPADECPLVEALIDIEVFRNYYDLVRETGESVRLEFYGNPDDRLATYVTMHGELEARLYLPMSDSILQKMPLTAPTKFDDENVWDSGVRLDTHIHTTVDTVDRIIDAVDADDVSSIDNYPIVVENGVFTLEVTGTNQRNRLTGTLNGGDTTVDGPDVANLYGSGFADIFATLDGQVTLQTKAVDGGAPLAVVTSDADGVLRHVIGSCGSL